MAALKDLKVGETATISFSVIRHRQSDRTYWVDGRKETDNGRDLEVTRTAEGLMAVRNRQHRIRGQQLSTALSADHFSNYLQLDIRYI